MNADSSRALAEDFPKSSVCVCFQISNLRQDVNVTSNDLLTLGVEGCEITRAVSCERIVIL